MTATIDTATWQIVHESPWTETDEHLAGNMAAALRNVASMVDEFPEVAPLLERMLRNLINPVSATRNPLDAMAALAHASAAHGGSVSKAEYGGVNIDFGPAVRMLVLTEAPPAPEPIVFEAVPEPPVDEPDAAETPAEPVADDADPLAETAAFDTAAEVATS